MTAPEPPRDDDGSPADGDVFAVARAAMDQALRVAHAALALLRAELRLARSSAIMMIWLGFAMVFLGIGAWLATSAAIAAGIYQLTGNIFYGVGSVALLNLLGIVWVALLMRSCWRDLTLPRTRRMLQRNGQASVPAGAHVSRKRQKAQILAAQRQLAVEQQRWQQRSRRLHRLYERQREMIIVIGGFASGVIAGLLPLRGFARMSSAAVSVASFALRSPIASVLTKKLVQAQNQGSGKG